MNSITTTEKKGVDQDSFYFILIDLDLILLNFQKN